MILGMFLITVKLFIKFLIKSLYNLPLTIIKTSLNKIVFSFFILSFTFSQEKISYLL